MSPSLPNIYVKIINLKLGVFAKQLYKLIFALTEIYI